MTRRELERRMTGTRAAIAGARFYAFNRNHRDAEKALRAARRAYDLAGEVVAELERRLWKDA